MQETVNTGIARARSIWFHVWQVQYTREVANQIINDMETLKFALCYVNIGNFHEFLQSSYNRLFNSENLGHS